MPILAVLDETAHGGLDESLKTLYVQNTEDKKFYLDIAPDEAAKVAFNLQSDVKKKEDLLKKAHDAKRVAEDKAKLYEVLGLTPEQITELRDSKRPEDIQKLVEAHKTEIEKVTKSFEEPLTAAQEKAKKYEAEIQKQLTASAIAKLRNDFDLNETADYVLRDFIRAVPREEGSDEYVTAVFENGSPALVAGQPMTPDQLIKGFQEGKKFPAMFNAGIGGGTGGTNRQQQGFTGSIIKVDREASKTDPQLYRQAKEQAAKTGATVAFTD